MDAEFGWISCEIKTRAQPSSWEFTSKQRVDRLVILRVLFFPFINKVWHDCFQKLFTTEEADLHWQNGASTKRLEKLRGGQHPQMKEAPSLVRDFKDRFKQREKGGPSNSWQGGRHVSPVTIVYMGMLVSSYKNYPVYQAPLPHSHLAPSAFPHPSFSPHSATVLWALMWCPGWKAME